MKITNNVPVPAIKRAYDVASGQVFSFREGRSILLMTMGNKYVHLADGAVCALNQSDMDRPVDIYDHELILRGIL